ncbi:MAG: protein kinase [Acidobacteria bacterium]|nr:protein kinase [Acidobacteriota bacterium]
MPLQDRYEIRDVIGKGGMGVVYRAWDKTIRREVALKTIRDSPSREALELFRKECAVLARISHPNIIEIFDLGELEEEGSSKPYFVMPLLNGQTLDAIIRRRPARLSVERVVDIVCQTSRGLQAAHEKGLVHRDLKPSNIFILGDDSVKIIDFGVAHMADTHSTIGHKGTLVYMSPEQLEMKPLTPLSDLFSAASICYEALTGHRPFERPTQSETVRAILALNATPASELNPAVSPAVGRVIHKAMAKQPRHRFSSAREFAEALQKALRNEPLEFMDPSRAKPRVERAARAFEQGDLAFAGEILGELEAEGFLSTEVTSLRRNLDRTLRTQRLELLLTSARTRFGEQEYALALEKLSEIAQLDAGNTQALALRARIDALQLEQKLERLLRQAEEELAASAYEQARESLQEIVTLRPGHPRALELAAETGRREDQDNRARQERYDLFEQAVVHYRAGVLTEAVAKLERVIELDQALPDRDDEGAAQRRSYLEQLRAEQAAVRAACVEAESRLTAGDYGSALAISNEFLARYPGHARFQALQAAIVDRGQEVLSGSIAGVSRQVEQEADLDRKIAVLEQAARLDPKESYFEQALHLLAVKRAQVRDTVARAQLLEEMEQFADALQHWEALRAIYPQYSGLEREIERLARLRDQRQRELRRQRRLAGIRADLEAAAWQRALETAAQALAEFPDDPEIRAAGEAAREGLARAEKASQLAADGRDLCRSGLAEPGLLRLREAFRLDPYNPEVRAALLENLVEHSRELLSADWRTAEVLAREAAALDPASPAAKTALALALDRSREERIRRVIAEARTLEAQGDARAALVQVEAAMIENPTDPRLMSLRATLREMSQAPPAKWKKPAAVAAILQRLFPR